MTRTLPDDQLERRVREALQHRSQRLPASIPPFEAGAPRLAFDGDAPRRRGRVALLGALALAAAVLVPVLVIQAHRGPARVSFGQASSPGTTIAAVDAPGALASAAVEQGLDLWAVTWSSLPVTDGLSRFELFGPSGGTGGKVLVQIGPALPGSSACCAPVTVRGQAGQVAPAKEFSGSTSTIYWQEDATVEASYSGMSEADALHMLGALTWRGPDHQAGFDAAASSGFELLGEAHGDPSTSLMTADLAYRDAPASLAPGQGRQIEVRTAESAGRTTGDYLKTWLDGQRLPDGAVQSFDSAFGTLFTVQPDGESVWIDANATPTDASALQRVLADVKPATGAQMLALRTAAEGRAAALALVAQTTVTAGTLSLHAGGGVQSLCLAVAGEPPRCTTPADAGAPAIGSFLIGGDWYVVAAGSEPLQLTAAGQTLPAQSVTLGTLDALVGQPRDGLASVSVGTAQQQEGVERPAF